MKWTPSQLDAIEAHDGTLLVSAAAGSGKTAVLVERVIRRLTDSKSPCSAENLLIVTFTNAAAAQMREKIARAVSARLNENPDDRRLARELTLLPLAKICTIDSFCASLVRENFHTLGLEPDFRLLDDSEAQLLRARAAQETVDKLYEDGSPGFMALADELFGGRDDAALIKTVDGLWSDAEAYSFPYIYLDSLLKDYSSPLPPDDCRFGATLRHSVLEGVRFCREALESLRSLALSDDDLSGCAPVLSSDIERCERLCDAAESKDWDSLISDVKRESDGFERMRGFPRGFDSPLKDYIIKERNNCKSVIQKKLPSLLSASQEEHLADCEALFPAVSTLVATVKLFAQRFEALKHEVNAIDFSDAEHLALNLLVERGENGKLEKTPLADELSQRYEEILVDEFQDVNELQNHLFSALSRDNCNLFFVGDIKQSIYGFRKAMPEIFLKHRASMQPCTAQNRKGNILLDRNFRSRSEVVSTVNFFFKHLMTRESGGIDYSAGEALVCAAQYPESADKQTELYLLDGNTVSDERHVAQTIAKMISDGFCVTENGVMRPARYGDFCILLRSVKSKAAAYVRELSRLGIPSHATLSGGFSSSAETLFMLSLLRVIDNPIQDVPLLSVLLSPVFGFSPDEVSRLRINSRNTSLYACVKAGADRGERICSDFISRLEELRRMSCAMGAGSLVRRLLEKTGYLAIAGAMPDGARRRSNLIMLEEYADRYEQNGGSGLSGFIRYIDKLNGLGIELASSSPAESANVVHIMTIHKSKGLEFPVCILSDCSKKFAPDLQSPLLVHPRMGIGMKRKTDGGFKSFNTLGRLAVLKVRRLTDVQEELRVIYVAMTRAKEKLIIVSSQKNICSKLRSLRPYLGNGKVSSYFINEVAQSISDLLLCVALCHPDAHLLREKAGVDFPIFAADGCPISFSVAVGTDEQEDGENVEQIDAEGFEAEKARCAALIAERLSYEYPLAGLSRVVAKQGASELAHRANSGEYFASRTPAFLLKGKLSPAERGTAMHRFMQLCDYHNAHDDIRAERDRLLSEKLLSEAEANSLDLKKLSRFFEGELARRIFASPSVYREKRFAINLPANELYDGLPEGAAGETVLVQGIADCAFMENGSLVILDYKTDLASPAELVERYSEQLQIYSRALSEILSVPVSELLIYSFNSGETVPVD